MSEEDEAEPVVELGDDPPVEGAPIARVASRLSWPTGKSDILEAEGDTEIRTGDGPIALESLLDEVELGYFARQQEFTEAIRTVIGYGPVPPADE